MKITVTLNHLGRVQTVHPNPRECVVDGCSNPIKVKMRQLCNAHWLRLKRHGDVRGGGPDRRPGRTPAERFWERVQQDDGCWEWQGARDTRGYGALNLSGNVVRAHVISWWLAHGRFTLSGEYVLHHCDNPPCVRPDHLYLGTAKDNTRDMLERGRGGPQMGHVWEWAQRKRLANEGVF